MQTHAIVCVVLFTPHTFPPAHCRAMNTVRSPGRKAGLRGRTLRRDRLTGQFLSLLSLWQDADGLKCQGKAKRQSVSTHLADGGDVKQSCLVASLCLLCTEPCMLTQREKGRPDEDGVARLLKWSVTESC